MENPNPTREEVRDWFPKHPNVCRCTGYKQLVDAVMLAAEVMRGEKTIEEIWYKPDDEKKEYYSEPVVRPSALGKACGTVDYGDDMELKMPAGTLHVALVQPRQAAMGLIKTWLLLLLDLPEMKWLQRLNFLFA